MTLSSKLSFVFFLLLLLLSLSNVVKAQPGCEMSIVLRTQAEVDAFSIPPGGSPGVISGSLTIAPEAADGTTDIINLDGLSSLTQVHGTLLIERNPILSDISGLSNLTTIGGGTCSFQELVIRQNPQIASLEGLQNVTGFVSRLMIQDAPLVSDIDELSNVTGSDFLWVGGMTGITNVDGLQSFTTLGGLFLTNNANLLNIDGLSGASGPFTGGQDFISGNPMLQNLNGLAGLTGVNTLTIRNCDALVDMSGLGGMTEVTNLLSINNNPGITSLNGLNPNLEIGNKLTVVGNTLLSDCAVEAVCNHLDMNGNNFITANPAGCASSAQVIASCTLLPIELLSFSARLFGKSVRLDWQTASEENTEKFALERSVDGGRTFQLTGVVAARNSETGAAYQYLDEQVDGLSARQLYYRLRVQDFDGTNDIFGPISIELRSFASSDLKVFPNPLSVGEGLHIQGAAAGAKVELRAMDGQLLATFRSTTENTYSLPELAPGVYMLSTLNESGKLQTRKIVLR